MGDDTLPPAGGSWEVSEAEGLVSFMPWGFEVRGWSLMEASVFSGVTTEGRSRIHKATAISPDQFCLGFLGPRDRNRPGL